MRTRKLLKYAAVAICIIGVSATLPFFYVLPQRLDPQGNETGGCIVEKVTSVLNKSQSAVASAHRTFCTDVIHDAAVYVFMHKPDEIDSAQSLIFRYYDNPDGSLPEIAWSDDSSLSISVGDVVQITKMVTALNGLSIKYFVKGEKIPKDAWATHIRILELIAAGVIFFAIVMLFLIAILIRSICRDSTGAQTL